MAILRLPLFRGLMKKRKDLYDARIGEQKNSSKEHWEVDKDLNPKGDNSPWGAFNPRSPAERPCTHVKTNECDY